MTIETAPRENFWNYVKPDSGLDLSSSFSRLCSKIGAHGIQVERIDLFDKEATLNLRPIYGFALLFQHQPELNRQEFTSHHDLYFANQVKGTYALHALLSIIFNCDLELSRELQQFKQLTKDLSPKMKGYKLSNHPALREANNSLTSRRNTTKGIYHSISYMKVDEYVWELDGLKRGPLKLGSCNEQNWVHLVHEEVLKKYEMYHKQKIPMTLWAVIENRKLVYQRKLVERSYIKQEIENTLDRLEPGWRFQFIQWIEEYNHAMNTERKRRGFMLSKELMNYCKSFDQLSIHEQTAAKESLRYAKKESIIDAWLQVQDDSLRLYENLGIESEKDDTYKLSDEQIKRDYTPFIQSYIKALFEEGHLESILDLR